MSMASEANGLDMDALQKQVEESMSDFALTEEDGDLSDYEKLRLRNIERNRRMLALCCSESKNKLDELFKKPEAPPLTKRRSSVVKTPSVPTEIRRSRRIQNMPPRKLIKIKMFGQTYSSCNLDDVEFLEEEYVEEEWDPDTDFNGWNSCNYKRVNAIKTPKRQRKGNGRVGRVPVDQRTHEEITPEDTANIVVRGKFCCCCRGIRYGTTCHQCWFRPVQYAEKFATLVFDGLSKVYRQLVFCTNKLCLKVIKAYTTIWNIRRS
uniref:Uncharacterized protein n=1 Tax=Clastoptera arizonana TaxID=38151 RepID=A0A1B6DKW8_9HEMI